MAYVFMVLMLCSQGLFASTQIILTQEQEKVAKQKSTFVGLTLSASGVVVPIATGFVIEPRAVLFATGVMIGPSIGHWYAGQWGRGLVTIGLRLGGVALGAVGYSAAWSSSESAEAMIFPILAVVIIGGTGIYDFVTISSSVRKYNEKQTMEIKPELDLERKQYGLKIVYHF